MLLIPGMTVTAPKDGSEMLALLRLGVSHDGPFAIRWPRDAVPAEVPALSAIPAMEYGTWETMRKGADIALLATGTMVLPAVDAAQTLSARGIEATVVNCRFLKPYDREALEAIVAHHDKVVTMEEGTVVNGFGSYMAREIARLAGDRPVRVECMGIPDRFIAHGGREVLLAEMGLDAAGIETKVRAMLGKSVTSSSARETA